MGHENWSKEAITDFFQIDAIQAEELISKMRARGFLQASEPRRGDTRRFYECGPQGARLAAAKLLKAITRAKADAIIAAFLQRVAEVNERLELLERVCEVRVFGSYLEERDDLADVDIAVR